MFIKGGMKHVVFVCDSPIFFLFLIHIHKPSVNNIKWTIQHIVLFICVYLKTGSPDVHKDNNKAPEYKNLSHYSRCLSLIQTFIMDIIFNTILCSKQIL